MECRAKPYQGSEPFAFFSYCHDDSPRVYPLIERLTEMGYRIWFDAGIDIGDEWPEIIARKLEECTLFLVAVTPNYCRSHNCKNEMTYQVEDQKPMLPLMLEDFPLSGGIKLQLAASQYLKLFAQPEASWAAATAAGSKLMEKCKGAPIPIDPPVPTPPPDPTPSPDPKPVPNPPIDPVPVYAIWVENGRVMFGRDGQVILTPGQQIPGPVLTVGEDGFVLEQPGQEKKTIRPGTLVYTDAGTFLPVSQTELENLKQLGTLRFLQADRTGEVRQIGREPFCLGRHTPWEDHILTDRRIGRRHAEITLDAQTGTAILENFCLNGTYVDGIKLTEPQALKDGDEIGILPDIFHYHAIALDFSDEAREQSYDEALLLLEHDNVQEDIIQAEKLFSQLGDFRDCGRLQLCCKSKLEKLRQEKLWQEKLQQQEALYQQALQDIANAARKLGQLRNYKNAEELRAKCDRLVAEAGEPAIVKKDDIAVNGLLVVELATGEVFRGKYPSTTIGRKINQCDIPFPDDFRMNRCHAELFTQNGVHYVRDCNSPSGTYLNGQKLERNETRRMENPAFLTLGMTNLLVVFDEEAAWLRKEKTVSYLEDRENGEQVVGNRKRREFLTEDPDATVIEGQKALCLSAVFWQEEGRAWLEPRMGGNVLLNGTGAEEEKPIELTNGDVLRIGNADYDFRSIRLISL